MLHFAWKSQEVTETGVHKWSVEKSVWKTSLENSCGAANFFSFNGRNTGLSIAAHINGHNPKVTAKTKYSDQNPLLNDCYESMSCCEIKLNKKIIRVVVKMLNEFWLFTTADACDAYHNKNCIRRVNEKYPQVSIFFKKKNIWINDMHQNQR